MPRKPENLKCSFCNKSNTAVKKLIAGPNVYICNECIDICLDILKEETGEKEAPFERTLLPDLKRAESHGPINMAWLRDQFNRKTTDEFLQMSLRQVLQDLPDLLQRHVLTYVLPHEVEKLGRRERELKGKVEELETTVRSTTEELTATRKRLESVTTSLTEKRALLNQAAPPAPRK